MHDGAELIAARGFSRQANLVAALNHLKVEAGEVAVGQRRVAFAAVIARVASGDRPYVHQVAAHGHLRLAVHLQPYIALPFAGRHVVARHAARLKMRVPQRRKRGEKHQHPHARAAKSGMFHRFQHTALAG